MSGFPVTTIALGAQHERPSVDLYEDMALIRRFEFEAERQYKLANIGGYCHLSIGQEATCVGAVDPLEDGDILVTGYRSHGFALARGVSPQAVMAELFGREDGCARGRGGSMHLLDVDRGYYGGWGIVGGQMPIATGLALALAREDRPQVVVCEVGDGAVNMGAWHESLNLAALWRLPVVFLVVNNGYGMGTSVERASAEPELFRRAQAHRMRGERIDGDDVLEVRTAVRELAELARTERIPSVLEAMTYRYRGHSVADAGHSYRDKSEIEERRSRDPIGRLRGRLVNDGLADDGDLDSVDERVATQVEEAVAFAKASPEPSMDRLASGVYAPGSRDQFLGMRPGSPFGEVEMVYGAGLD